MTSAWRSKSTAFILEQLNDKIDDTRAIAYNFSQSVNQEGGKVGVGGKGGSSGAFGATSANQIFTPTRTPITSIDINGVDQTILDRINIQSRFMIVTGDDPNDLNVKWIQRAIGNGQPIWLMPETGKTLHLLPNGNIDIASQVDVADTQIVEVIFNEESDVTIDGGFTVVGLGSGGGGLNFPILYPEDDLGSVGLATINIDLSGTNGHFKQMTLTGDIGLAFTNPPAVDKFFEFWLQITQDPTGGWSIISTPSALKNGTTLDTLLDKAVNAVTVFHFTTGDGGVSYHAELVDLTTSSSGEFTGPMTAPHNYAGQNLANLGDIQFDIAGQSILSDALGIFHNVPLGKEHSFLISGAEKLKLDTISMDLGVDIDLNPTGILAHTISGFDLLQLQSDAGVSYGTVTPDTSAFPGWLLTMGANQDFIIAGSGGEKFRFQPDTSPRLDMTGGLLSIFAMQSSGGDVYQIILDETLGETSINTTNTMKLKSGGNERINLNSSFVEMRADVDMDTFNIFDIDNIIFQTGTGSALIATDVGLGGLAGGGIHNNVLDAGIWKISEELTTRVEMRGVGFNFFNLTDLNFTVSESIGGTQFSITKANGRTDLSDPTEINLQVSGLDIMTLNSVSIDLANGISFTNVDQIGFRILGNFIEDDLGGMIFRTVPGDNFNFGDGTDIFGTLDKNLFALQFASMQIPKIAVPTDPGINTAGKVFYNTADNRLSFRRRNDGDTAFETIDLEGSGGGSSFADDVFDIHDNVTPAKILQFSLSQMTVGTSIIDTVAMTGTRTWSLPNITGTFIMDTGVQTITGVKTFQDGTLKIEEPIGSQVGIFEVDPLSVDRTYTFPNLSGDVPLLNQTQTWTAQNTFNAKVLIGDIVDLVPANDLGSSLGDSTSAFLRGYFSRVVFDETTKYIDSSGALDLIFEVPSLGSMFFRENGTIFWELDGTNNINKFYRDIELTAGEAIRANSATEIGYFVTNATDAVGAHGTLQIPVQDSLTPTVSSLNTAFGSAQGSMGLYNTSAASVVLAIKSRTGGSPEWVLLAIPDAGGTVIGEHIN